ncbi:MAG: acyltransferase family protein [Sphingobium sp.]
MKAGEERLDWLDAAKGIGIVLVVIGHVWTRGSMRDAIYAFHMPLFFLLAGYVTAARPMGEFMRRQWRGAIIPYLAFLAVLMGADFLIEHWRGHRPYYGDWQHAARAALIGGSELRGPFTIFWFMPCLVVARIIQNALMLRWPNPRDGRWAATMAVSLAIGLWVGARTDFSPQGLLSVPVALVLLWLGALWRLGCIGGCLMFLAAIASLWLYSAGLMPVNMKAGDYGVPVLSLGIAVILSLGLSWLARVIPWRPLCALGRMSMVIMYLHVAVIHYCRPYIGNWWLVALSLAVCVAAYHLLDRSSWSRRYFLGEARA